MPNMIRLGGAREFLKVHKKLEGRREKDLEEAIQFVMDGKSGSVVGSVAQLCTSPINGARMPCEFVEVRQSLVGDCQSSKGWHTVGTARVKNVNSILLGKKNLLVESLLCGITVSDHDLVSEVVQGLQAPRLDEVWVTGDNVYAEGLDMSWHNFGVGDLLVLPGLVIVNSGFPHFACWKYAVRAGNGPKKYINSIHGTLNRVRGIKGAVLLPRDGMSTIHAKDTIRIVRRDSEEFEEIVQNYRPPLLGELVYHGKEGKVRVSPGDTKAYIDLLVEAGCDAAVVDATKYKRDLPVHLRQVLKMQDDHRALL